MTVFETRVHLSWARKARIAFYTVGVIVAVVAFLVASTFTRSPILAALVSFASGLVAGGLAFVAVSSWPYVRIMWWWAGEIALAVAFYYEAVGVFDLPMWLRVVWALVVFGPLALPRWRRLLVAFGWCFIVRHRLRTCFAQFIIANRSGSLPLILIARPTPVGERVWIYLRPGLSLADLGNRIEKIAVACHASSVVVDRASASNAAFIRVDIKRREVLDVPVSSPLVGTIDDANLTDAVSTVPYRWQPDDLSDLDLSDASDAPVSPAAPKWTGSKPSTPASPASPAPTYEVAGSTEDYSDYID